MITLWVLLLSSKAFAFDGIVEKQSFSLPSFVTEQGQEIRGLKVGYESYGKLNANKTNAILITHFFSGSSHAAGRYDSQEKGPGYWDSIIGPGKALDTQKYFILSSDTLVNVNTKSPKIITTGPASLAPDGKRYGMRFPFVSIKDFVSVQKALLDSLGIQKLVAVIGASSGAAQAMEWGIDYPDKVSRVIAVIPPGLALPSYTVAMLNLWSMPIELDPEWRGG